MSPAARRTDLEGAGGRELDSNQGNIRAGNADGVDSPVHRSSDCVLAYLFRWRWKFIIESVVALPLVLPPTVLGFYILVAIGPHSPFGRLYTDLVGHPLPFTFEGLLLASILYSLPFAVQPFASAFDQVDRGCLKHPGPSASLASAPFFD